MKLRKMDLVSRNVSKSFVFKTILDGMLDLPPVTIPGVR